MPWSICCSVLDYGETMEPLTLVLLEVYLARREARRPSGFFSLLSTGLALLMNDCNLYVGSCSNEPSRSGILFALRSMIRTCMNIAGRVHSTLNGSREQCCAIYSPIRVAAGVKPWIHQEGRSQKIQLAASWESLSRHGAAPRANRSGPAS